MRFGNLVKSTSVTATLPHAGYRIGAVLPSLQLMRVPSDTLARIKGVILTLDQGP